MTSNGAKDRTGGKGIHALDDWLKELVQFWMDISEIIEFFRFLLDEIKD